MTEEKKSNEEFIPLRLDRQQDPRPQSAYGSMAKPAATGGQQPAVPQPVKPLSLEEWRETHDVPQQTNNRADRLRSRRNKKPGYRGRKPISPYGLSCLLFVVFFLGAVIALYIFAPENTNILVLGLDRSIEEGGWLSRSDTIILTKVRVSRAEVSLLSIPRDLWLGIPGYGENRINTAHYFGEVYAPGTGPATAISAIESNFGVPVDHYIRIKLEEFPRLIDAMGGVTVILEESMGGLPAGTHQLTGEQALAFVRDRAGTDDFYRMGQAQHFIQMLLYQLKQPKTWFRLPKVIGVAQGMVDTDIPFWLWGRYGFALLRAYPEKVASATLPRSMVNPFITDQGANVLLPDWNQIWPYVQELFAKPGIMQQLVGPVN